MTKLQRKPKNKKEKIAYAIANVLVDEGVWDMLEEPKLCDSCDSEISEEHLSEEEIRIFNEAFQAALNIK